MKTCVFTILVSNDSTLHAGKSADWRYHTFCTEIFNPTRYNRPSSWRSPIFFHWPDRGIVRVFFCYSAVLRVVRAPSFPSSMVWQGCFFFHCYLAISMTDWFSNFHRLVILCICWDTPTVKRLVFDNYRQCPLPLNWNHLPSLWHRNKILEANRNARLIIISENRCFSCRSLIVLLAADYTTCVFPLYKTVHRWCCVQWYKDSKTSNAAVVKAPTILKLLLVLKNENTRTRTI